jgi:hypothetical protein
MDSICLLVELKCQPARECYGFGGGFFASRASIHAATETSVATPGSLRHEWILAPSNSASEVEVRIGTSLRDLHQQ